MRILIVGAYAADWHERAWERALRELGHETSGFALRDYFAGGIGGYLQSRFVVGPTIERLNTDIVRAVRSWRPDIVVFYRALAVKPQTLRALAEGGSVALVCYMNDDLFGPLGHKSFYRLFRASVPHFDLHLVLGREEFLPRPEISEYRRLGAPRVQSLRQHYLPWLHRRLRHRVPARLRSDICFLGHCEPDRRLPAMQALIDGIDCRFRLNGSRWREFGRGRPWGRWDTSELQGEDYVAGINGAKIALAFFSAWNRDSFTRRAFEIPACGTFMLSQRTEAMREMFREDVEAAYFSSPEELVDKAKYYLRHESQRSRIAEAGRQRCLSAGFDIHSRMREWLGALAADRIPAMEAAD